MKSWTRILAAVAGLLVFVLVVAVAALHYRFPYDLAATVARTRVERHTPVRVGFGELSPGLPFRYRLTNVSLSALTPAGLVQVLSFDEVNFRFHPLSLLVGRIAFDIKAASEAGRVEASAGVDLFGQRNLLLEIPVIDLPDFFLAQPSGPGRVQGRLAGELTVQGADGVFPTAGRGRLELGPGKIDDVQIPDFPISTLDFDRMSLDFTLGRDRVDVQKLEALGPQGSLNLAGRLTDFRALKLAFSGSAQMGSPEQPLASVSFRLTGTATRPRVQVGPVRGPGGMAKTTPP